MPCLPKPRPHALKPSSSTQDLTVSAKSSPLFDKLPPEIRRQNLILAFGDRTVHMDLILEHPLNQVNPKKADGNPWAHRRPRTQFLVVLDRNQPRYWQCRVFTCHRMPTPTQRYFLDRERVEGPADDTCCSCDAMCCAMWTKR
jgi:hypothetical protein